MGPERTQDVRAMVLVLLYEQIHVAHMETRCEGCGFSIVIWQISVVPMETICERPAFGIAICVRAKPCGPSGNKM